MVFKHFISRFRRRKDEPQMPDTMVDRSETAMSDTDNVAEESSNEAQSDSVESAAEEDAPETDAAAEDAMIDDGAPVVDDAPCC